MHRNLLVTSLALLGAISCASLLWHVDRQILNGIVVTQDVQAQLCKALPTCKSIKLNQVFSTEDNNWRPLLVVTSKKKLSELDEVTLHNAIKAQGVLAALFLENASIKGEMEVIPSLQDRRQHKKAALHQDSLANNRFHTSFRHQSIVNAPPIDNPESRGQSEIGRLKQ